MGEILSAFSNSASITTWFRTCWLPPGQTLIKILWRTPQSWLSLYGPLHQKCVMGRSCKLPAQLLLQRHEMGKTTISISSGMGTTSVIHILLPTLLTLATPSGDNSGLQEFAPGYNIPWCECYSILACSQGISFLSPLQRQVRVRLFLEAFPEFSSQI